MPHFYTWRELEHVSAPFSSVSCTLKESGLWFSLQRVRRLGCERLERLGMRGSVLQVHVCVQLQASVACSLLPTRAAQSSMSKRWGICVLRKDEHLVPPDALGFRTHWVGCDESRSIKENEMPVWERQQVLHTSSCNTFCLLHTFTYQNVAGMPFLWSLLVTPPAAFSSAASFCSRWDSQWVAVKLTEQHGFRFFDRQTQRLHQPAYIFHKHKSRKHTKQSNECQEGFCLSSGFSLRSADVEVSARNVKRKLKITKLLALMTTAFWRQPLFACATCELQLLRWTTIPVIDQRPDSHKSTSTLTQHTKRMKMCCLKMENSILSHFGGAAWPAMTKHKVYTISKLTRMPHKSTFM